MRKEFRTIQTLVPMPVAEKRFLNESGKVDPGKLEVIAFDKFRHGYYAMGEKVGQAWEAGAALAKAARGGT